jgi:hypothetical protein
MCRISSLFLLQRLKGSMSVDARGFNNIETRAVIKFPPPCKARRRRQFTPFLQKFWRVWMLYQLMNPSLHRRVVDVTWTFRYSRMKGNLALHVPWYTRYNVNEDTQPYYLEFSSLLLYLVINSILSLRYAVSASYVRILSRWGTDTLLHLTEEKGTAYRRLYNSPPLDYNLKHFNPIHALTSHSLKNSHQHFFSWFMQNIFLVVSNCSVNDELLYLWDK